MYFKSAVILCMVYIFTSVWSIGLHRDQILRCIKLYKNRDVLDNNFVIPRLMKNGFGIQNPDELFKYDPNKPYYTHFTDLFLVLAYNGTIDKLEIPTLMPFEVELYIKTFNKHAERIGVHGCLDGKEISDVFEDLNINGKEKTKAEKLVSDQGIGMCYAAELLLVMLEMLPEGNGLNQSQIEDFIQLYKTNSARIDPLKIQKIFIEFGMTTESNKDLLLFNSNRPAAIELMELMIITAERSKTVRKSLIPWKEVVLSTDEVRSSIAGFKKLDTDHDGILSGGEAGDLVNEFNTNNRHTPIVFYFENMNVAEYLYMTIEKKKRNGWLPSFLLSSS